MNTETTTTTSGANAASARLTPSIAQAIEDLDGVKIINGVRCKHVAAYTTTSGKHIAAHWRPIRCCRSYGATSVNAASAQALRSAVKAQRASIVLDEVAPKPIILDEGKVIDCNTPAPSNGANGATPAPAANVDMALVPNVPEYIPQDGEVRKFEVAIKAGKNIMLTGPTGCGKTLLTERYCMNNMRECFTIQGGAGATYERIVSQKDLVSDGKGGTFTTLTLGILCMAMKRGAVLYLDEPNAIPSEVLFYLFSAMDYRRTITLETGEVVKAAKGFVVIGAMNEGAGYAGTALLNAAFRSRSVIIDLKYLPEKREAELITKRSAVDKQTAKHLASIAQRLRSGVIKTPIGTRSLLDAADLIAGGLTPHEACEMAITNQIAGQFQAERKAVSDVVVSYFGLENK